MRRLIAIAALTATVAACATPTRYQPAIGPTAVGFTEQQIEADRFRVTFRGGGGANAAQVADYALLRAADLTLGAGYEWFVVDQRYTQQDGYGGGGPRFSVGVGGTDFGRRSAVGVGVGTGFSLGGGPALSTTLEIRMGRGARPTGFNVYDAARVRSTIAPRAGYPV
jgi:hypothetical protein